LDLGSGAYNRVATGLEFLSLERQTAFTRAAIADGLLHLQRIKDGRPFVAPVRVSWPRLGAAAALCIGLCVIAGSLDLQARRIVDAGDPCLGGGAAVDRPDDAGATQSERLQKPAATRRQEQLAAALTPEARHTAALALPTPKAAKPALGHSGAGGGSASPQVNPSAASHGGSPGASASSGDKSDQRQKSGGPRIVRPPREPVKPVASNKEGGAAVNAGTPGAGALTQAHHDWPLNAQSAARDEEDEDGDEPTEQERRSSTQRGGMQPSLKDRREAPSRELGLSGDQGRPGTGRGGPTPPKKSRGTASLVLGVPVPDFVRGRLGPGPTKVNKEHGRPVPMSGELLGHAPVRSRASPETSCRRQAIPSEYAQWVRQYLLAIHEVTEAAAAAGNTDSTARSAGAE
jgi:hypothetical protein